jgi:hypothetical protein
MPKASDMKKHDCEKAIRALCHQWSEARGLSGGQLEHPSFSDFKSWLSTQGYAHYLRFRSLRGPEGDAEQWFDEEFKQTWRN